MTDLMRIIEAFNELSNEQKAQFIETASDMVSEMIPDFLNIINDIRGA